MPKTATPTPTKTPEKKATRRANPPSISNKVAFTGRLGRDPEMSYTPGGKTVTRFSIAVWQGKDKEAMWLDIVAWEEVAEHVSNDATKGTEVEVQGRLTQDSWEDKTTKQKRKAFKVVASEVTILRKGKEGDESGFADDEDEGPDALGDLDKHPF